jgi:uncharacterized hydrophobic protein (TIGR00271 family)
MLHVRVVSPADLTAGVVGLLAADPAVINLVVLTGAVVGQASDAVQFDLARAGANPVLRRLRDLQAEQLGPIVIEEAAAVIGAGQPARPHLAARRRGTYHGETAPVWDLVESKIAADSTYAPSFYVLLILAGLIGAVGILTNSTVLIVGAMVVGPEYNATIAVALGLERRDRLAVRRGLGALVVGFVLTIVVTMLFSLIIRWAGQVPRGYELGLRPVSDLISSPDVFSVIVAVLAGIIGVVSLTEARAGALIGVFISVTTIPAAADIGLSLALHSWAGARGATLQLLLNLVLLIVVGALALRVQRLAWRDRAPSPTRISER